MDARKHFIVMVREWDDYAGEGGNWIWRLFAELVMYEKTLQVVLDDLEASGKVFAYGEAQSCTCGTCLVR